MKLAGQYAIVALIALVLTVLPGGGPALAVALALLSVVFFTLIALMGARLYRQYQLELSSLSERQRLVMYGSIGVAFLAFCGTHRMFDTGAAGIIGWFFALSAASFGLYWVWVQYRTYS